MTDKELNLAAKPRGHKSPIMLAAFRAGFTAACNGKTRDEHALMPEAKREIAAWQSGWDYLAESQQQVTTADERTIEIDGASTAVTLHAIPDGGFECFVPIGGQTVSAYGDTEEIALAAARDRLIAAAREAKARENDPKTMECGLDVEVGGATYEVIQRDYKSGRFDLRVAAFPDITLDGTEDDDQDKALETIAQRIAEHLGVVDARTVDGEPAIVDTDPKPRASQLPIRTSADCAAEVHRCMTEVLQKTVTADRAKQALKSAENALDAANLALLDAVDREARPELPLVPA